jgi:hypothetical protein
MTALLRFLLRGFFRVLATNTDVLCGSRPSYRALPASKDLR